MYLFSVINKRILGPILSLVLKRVRKGRGQEKFKHLFLKLQHTFQPPLSPCVPEEEPQQAV